MKGPNTHVSPTVKAMVGILCSSTVLAQTTSSSLSMENFCRVTPAVYRGSRPQYQDLKTLAKKYGIRTLIDLESGPSVEREKKWIQQINQQLPPEKQVHFVSLPLPLMNLLHDPQKTALAKQNIRRALQILQDPAAQPVYLHCRQGRDRTGTVMGLLRVQCNHWDPEQAWKNEVLEHDYHTFLKWLHSLYGELAQESPVRENSPGETSEPLPNPPQHGD